MLLLTLLLGGVGVGNRRILVFALGLDGLAGGEELLVERVDYALEFGGAGLLGGELLGGGRVGLLFPQALVFRLLALVT